MVAGFVLLGTAARHLGRAGYRPVAVAAGGMFAFMLVQGVILMDRVAMPLAVWVLFGILGTSGIVSYAELSQRFPPHLIGRVNTGLNLLVFVAAFALQWGTGAVIGLWPPGPAGGYAPEAYRAAFGLMLALQAIGLLWYLAMDLHIRRTAARRAARGG